MTRAVSQNFLTTSATSIETRSRDPVLLTSLASTTTDGSTVAAQGENKLDCKEITLYLFKVGLAIVLQYSDILL